MIKTYTDQGIILSPLKTDNRHQSFPSATDNYVHEVVDISMLYHKN